MNPGAGYSGYFLSGAITFCCIIESCPMVFFAGNSSRNLELSPVDRRFFMLELALCRLTGSPMVHTPRLYRFIGMQFIENDRVCT